MQFKVPFKYADLTLGQLITIHTEDDPFKRVSACSNVSLDDLRELPMNSVTEADEHLKKIADMESGRHLRTIELSGKQYGFIPDWGNLSLGEWIDIEQYCEDFWGNAHKIISILYRPVDRMQGDIYTIKKYTAKEDAETFKDLPADLFGGAMIFFLNSRRKLLTTMKYSLLKGVKAQINSVANGDGIPSFTPLHLKAYSRWTLFQNFLWGLPSRISHSLKI